jgi:hypothetical protein
MGDNARVSKCRSRGRNVLAHSVGRLRLRLERIAAGSWCRARVSVCCARCCRRNDKSGLHLNMNCCFALAPHRDSAYPRQLHARSPTRLTCELSHRVAPILHNLSFKMMLCPALLYPPMFINLPSGVSPPSRAIFMAKTHLTLSRFTGAAGALAAKEANAARAGMCADPYLWCPGESFEADDGLVTESVNGGCEFCCRGWKCA